MRMGFWGPLYYKYNKEPLNSIGDYFCPYIIVIGWMVERNLRLV